MSNSIKVSKKYGVNPTICKCFFCGADKGIALLGHIGDYRKHEDIEAPKECVMDYEPCEQCQETMNKGVTLIEVSETQPSDGRPPMKAQGNKEVYPLGRFLVVTCEAVERMTGNEFEKGSKVFVDSQLMDMITSKCK